MQEKGKQDDGFGPLGICHRLFNFIMNSFITRGTRRITLGTTNSAPRHVDESRALEGTRRVTLGTSNAAPPDANDFRALEDKVQEELIRPDDHELRVEFRHTNGSMVNRTKNVSGQVLVQEKKNSTQPHKKTDSQGKGNGGQEKATKRSTLTIAEGRNLHGRRHHLLSVASNINEKADAFIRSRKEAMEKTLSMKQTTDV